MWGLAGSRSGTAAVAVRERLVVCTAAAGTAVRFEPGQEREVSLIPFKGRRVVHGFNRKIMGEL